MLNGGAAMELELLPKHDHEASATRALVGEVSVAASCVLVVEMRRWRGPTTMAGRGLMWPPCSELGWPQRTPEDSSATVSMELGSTRAR